MDPVHLKKLVETPVTLTLNAYQFGLITEWLQVETLERSGEIQPMEPDSQAYAQAVQQLQELDGILASMRAVYRQAAQELNIPSIDGHPGERMPTRSYAVTRPGRVRAAAFVAGGPVLGSEG
jgi:hypothetical protein